MKRMVKTLSVIVIVVALLLGGGAVAATPGVMVSIDAPDEAVPDSDFTANISISGVADFDACQYDVSFDGSVLRLDNITSGLIGSTEIPVGMYNEINPGTYRIIQNVPGLSGASGNGYLAVLHFHAIGEQGSQISLSNGLLSDIEATEIEATWAGGSVGVTAEAPQATTPPPAANPSPEPTAPSEAALLPPPPPAGSGSWPVLWVIIGGVVLVGLIILVVARRRAY
jgi:hypothetical protein